MNELRFFLKWVNLSVHLFAGNLLLILGGLQGSFFRYATSSSCQEKVDSGLLEEGPTEGRTLKRRVCPSGTSAPALLPSSFQPGFALPR